MMNCTQVPTIRLATGDDAQLLAELGAATFTETFAHLYPPEDLQAFLKESHSIGAWRRILSDPDCAVWIALLDEVTPIGFVSVGSCILPIENLEPSAGQVRQLYVLKQYRNLRLGSKLMDIGLDWLEQQQRTPLYIGVWSENHGAQRFYTRYGFRKFGEYGYPVGETVDREFILKR